MKVKTNFTDILTAAASGWAARKNDDCVLSLALPIEDVDPLTYLPFIAKGEQFRFLWDQMPGFSLAASGKCQSFDLSGSRRFELAQRFTDITFGRLVDGTPWAPSQAFSRILFAFSFFEQIAECKNILQVPAAVQAVLPKWQLTRHGGSGWLRVNGLATNQENARDLAEQLWMMHQNIVESSRGGIPSTSFCELSSSNSWRNWYRPALIKGIDLIDSGSLEKLVLAVRQSICLKQAFDPLSMLFRLRHQQTGSCRFLWQRNDKESFFGASPERLLTVRQGILRSDALAGTTRRDSSQEDLMRSEKDLREHDLVVSSIATQLIRQGLHPRITRRPQLARHGKLLHLHTPISADAKGILPLKLVDVLHPTPAVAGLPRKEAVRWLRTLEPFDRGNYAAPIGWIDNSGDADFRVAIRCGNLSGEKLELTAGAGLVRGSVVEKEIEEVEMKLAVLADYFDLEADHSKNSVSRHSIT